MTEKVLQIFDLHEGADPHYQNRNEGKYKHP